MRSPINVRGLVSRFAVALVVAFVCLVDCHPAFSQTAFTKTYQVGGGIEVACCSKGPMSWGFTPVIQDTSLSGNVQITSISVSDNGNILATDPNGVAGTTWEIFAGSGSCGFPVGELEGVVQLGTYSCNSQTQLIFNTNGVFSAPASGTFAASFDFTNGAFTANDLGAFILGATSPTNLTQGLVVQVLLWGGDFGADLILNNISVTVTGTIEPTIRKELLGASGSTTNPTASFAEPINTATGNYFSSATDLAVPGRGMALVFNRYYNSLDSYSGPLGPGWTHSYNAVLTNNPTSGAVTIKQPDGSSVGFAPNGSGGYNPSTIGLFDKLEQNGNGSFVLTKRNQVKLQFASTGQLLSVSDRNGNMQELTYNTSGDLTSITDTVGRVYILSYDSNHHLTSLLDPSGRTVSYSYDGNGHLVNCTNPAGGVTTYSYDSNARLTTAVNPRGVTYVQNTFDTSGRVVAQSNGRGIVTLFAYDTPTAGITTITDGNGNTLQHLYDNNFRLIESVDGKGATTTFSYDSNNDRIGVTDANGNTTQFAYDSFGNVTAVTDALGAVASFSYNSFNNVTSTIAPNSSLTVFLYDPNGNLVSMSDALGDNTHLTHDSNGQLVAVLDPLGDLKQFAWDNLGDLIETTDGVGRKRTFGYDELGRMTSASDGLGHSSKIQYDTLGRVVSLTDPLGNQTLRAYNEVGELSAFKDPNGNETSYGYDAMGNLITMTDAIGHRTIYGYDFNNNLVSLTNARAKSTSYSFDAANRRIGITDPLMRMTTFVYDPVGNLVSEKLGNGKSRSLSYNALNRPVSVKYEDGSEVLFSYDKDRNRVGMTDSFGITTYNYDKLDRLTQITRFDGRTLSYAYDEVGNRISLTYPDGRSIHYTYDGSNAVNAVSDESGKPTTYMYDEVGRLISTTLPNGLQTTFRYDEAARLLQVLNTSRSRLVSSFDYKLDNVGNRVQIGSSQDGISTYAYDKLNRLTAWNDVWGHSVNYSYDEVGNRTEQTSKEGTKFFRYDDADELTAAGLASFTYDGNGNRLTRSIPEGTTFYSWDSADRLQFVRSPSRNVYYEYDGNGNRIGKSTDSVRHSYVNDVHLYAPDVVADYRGDVTIDYVYGHSLIAAVKGSDADYVDYDGLGSAVDTSENNGTIRASFSYDPWGNSARHDERVAEGSDDDEANIPIRFAGQTLDQADGIYYLRARYYDPEIGRFLSRDPLGVRLGSPYDQNRYVYARNNPVRYIDPLGLSSETYTLPAATNGPATFQASSPNPPSSPSHICYNTFAPYPCDSPELPLLTSTTGAASAFIVYVSPVVVMDCAANASACTALAVAGLENITGQKSGLPFDPAENNTQAAVDIGTTVLDPTSLQDVIQNVNNIVNTFGATQPGTDSGSGPIFYLDPQDPSGISDSDPNLDSSPDDSED